eukprot:633529-Pyramimonas_sp.AAC.1
MGIAFEALSAFKQILFLKGVSESNIDWKVYLKQYEDYKTFCASATEQKTQYNIIKYVYGALQTACMWNDAMVAATRTHEATSSIINCAGPIIATFE